MESKPFGRYDITLPESKIIFPSQNSDLGTSCGQLWTRKARWVTFIRPDARRNYRLPWMRLFGVSNQSIAAQKATSSPTTLFVEKASHHHEVQFYSDRTHFF